MLLLNYVIKAIGWWGGCWLEWCKFSSRNGDILWFC